MDLLDADVPFEREDTTVTEEVPAFVPSLTPHAMVNVTPPDACVTAVGIATIMPFIDYHPFVVKMSVLVGF